MAITLIILLSTDTIVDSYALISLPRNRLNPAHHHTGVVVVARLVLGVAYIALFMVYVGMWTEFQIKYIFWGLDSSLASPVVYIFLWMIGVWDLLHATDRKSVV